MWCKRDKLQRLTLHFPLIIWIVMNLESKNKCTVLDGTGVLIVNVIFFLLKSNCT